MKRKDSFFLICCFFGIVGLFSSHFALANVSSYSKKAQESWLLVLSAAHAMIHQQGNQTVLELDGVDPKILAFTDRPVRQVMYPDVKGIVRKWGKLFGTDQPNAALVYAELKIIKNKRIEPMVFELAHPKLDLKTGRLVFNVDSVGHDVLRTQQLNDVDLFIDNISMGRRFGGN